ncbi:MAG TPA: tetratricopeptide repeat protein [Anaerohalosphaeraceae bacterium]|nr:tetratricopeptide repeat protein [Anaerohalosphaeraceae bacterium]
MKKTGMLWLCLLIGSAAAVGAAPAGEPGKSVTVLFQDALYQEQTAGDLDKAIELYQKVLDEAGQTEKLAAKAAYQLGMCYLKKDDKAKAAEYFKTVVAKYGTQKDLANDARKQLEQVAPQTGPEGGVFAKLPEAVLVRLSTLYGQLSAEAGEKGLFSNCHIHYIDTDMRRYSGGLGYFQNTGDIHSAESQALRFRKHRPGLL